MTQATNFRWAQGEDLTIELIYKEGDNPKTAVPVPLNAGYSLRMDIVNPATGVAITSLTSDDDEASLMSGENGTPNIAIYLPREYTLPAPPDVSPSAPGVLFTEMLANRFSFGYDIFLRNTESNKQIKLLRGTITVEDSHTLWS